MRAICFKNLFNSYSKFYLKNFNSSVNKTESINKYLKTVKNFSETDSKPDISYLNNILFQTKEDKDLKYEDDCFYFQKEWKKLQEDKYEKKQDYMSKDLSDHQKKECDILIERILRFNAFESRYFNYVFKDLIDNNAGVAPFRPNVFDIRRKFVIDVSRPEDNPNNKNTQEILSVLIPFISSGYFSGGGASLGTTEKQSEGAKAEEPKKEKEVEKVLKPKVDIRLVTFDSAKKIALIKEVRTYLNLGLKEAKELVEKVPGLIKGGVLRAEAEEMQKKLEANGAKIELV